MRLTIERLLFQNIPGNFIQSRTGTKITESFGLLTSTFPEDSWQTKLIVVSAAATGKVDVALILILDH